MPLTEVLNAAIIVVYLAGMLGIGLFSFRRIRSLSSFYVFDRKGGAVQITGSLLATVVGASSTLGIAGLGFSMGLVGAWWMLVGAAGLLIMSFWLSEKVRSYEVYTLPEILKAQYDSDLARVISSVLIAIAWIGVIAAQIIAAGKIITALWQFDLKSTMVAVGSVMVVYTALGGQYSIIKTDLIQSVIILVGIAVCLAFIGASMGELSAMTAALPSGHFSFPVSPAFTALDLLLFFLFVGSVFVVGPDIFSRLFCARTPRAARRASSITACIMIPLAFAIAFIGIAARFLLPDIPAENAFPALVMHLLPSGFNALVMAALLAVVMSSADTCMLTAGTIVINDVIRPALPAGFPEKALVLLSRAAVLAIGALSIVIALKMQGIIGSLFLAYTIYSGGLVVPVLFGFYSERFRLRPAGAVLAIVFGGGTSAWLKLAGHEDLLLLSFPVSAVFLFAGSMVAGRLASKRRNIASRQME
ncbi:MAG: sodium:solute symporter family protein [Desulfomonilia bacterium]|jgi:SSS family solute:Na+ symporter|uniref:Sodium/glucose cotransporter n=1 Tax=anaerobic digester metagenome TaxID=1263854 RepID=A0A485LYD6_9ZZZZ|nr:sodium:solute symporter family protein [Pseudomonadota bacterium]HPD20745.1 sodium:solute symporter family protein [Deltaproteobacteria bacterium]HPX18545.1 sodium:solute symporter family protein [Deltaproteobacteria bacterium]HRS55028.1 sodium:solute symporter family protein [Desulfomonilia bacterium]HRV35264.1 sodium:solute symporter family protein [Desulfomonilia bacterium]